MRALLLLALLPACAPDTSGDEGAGGDDLSVCLLIEAPPPCEEEVVRYDTNGDGVDDTVVRTVRQGGLLVELEQDSDGDGVLDARSTTTYDDQGRILTESFDLGADGVDIVVDTHTWYDDSEGYAEWLDRGTDGTVDNIVTTHLDAGGRRVEVLGDNNGDGTDDQVERWEYDANGFPSARRFDNYFDGTYDLVERWTWDADGRLLRRSFDSGDDGEESWTVYTYDDCGHEVVRVQVASGMTRRFDWSYDERGHLVEELYDEYADGALESVTTYAWTGDVERAEVDFTGDGVADRWWESTWDADGRQIAYRADYEADGVVDDAWALDATCAP